MSVEAWARAWEGLAPETVPDLLALAHPEIRFRDPFQDFSGQARMERMLRHMFTSLQAPRFTVRDIAHGQAAFYLRWDFAFGFRGQARAIEGMSEVHLDAAGLVTAHLDHWDSGSQFYARLPLLGAVVRAVARRAAG